MSTAPSALHHVARILEAARKLGATITSAPGSSCYGSTCSYGTPSARSWYDAETRAWVSDPVVDDVIVHRAEWPLEPIPGQDPWHTRTTGPTMHELGRELGIDCPTGAPAVAHVPGSGIVVLVVYEHLPTLETNGVGGRGVVIAMGRRPSIVALEDERGIPHLVTDETGALGLGCFA